jgi:hypothetical protein
VADATRTIRTRLDGDASGLKRAAREGERAIDRFGRNAGKSFTSRWRQWVTGSEGAPTLGVVFGSLFGSGILKGLAIPRFGPIIAGALLGIIVAIAPVLGGALAAGLIAGMGAGLAGLGLVFAAQFQVVETAWSELAEHMRATLSQISGPLSPVLVNLAEMLGTLFDQFAPAFQQAFRDLAPALDEFFQHLVTAFERLEPTIQPVADAFIAMLGALGPELPGLFESIAGNIIEIADTVSEDPAAFALFFELALGAANALLSIISVLATAWSGLTEGLSSANATFLEALTNFGQLGALIAEGFLRLVANIVDSILFVAEQALAALALIPGPTQEAMQSARDSVHGLREDMAADFGGMIGDLEGWSAALENLPTEIALKGDISDLSAKLRDAKARLALVPPDKQVTVRGEISGLTRALEIAKIRLAQLQGKTIYINVITRQRLVLQPTSTAGGLTRFQHGGTPPQQGPFVVGEAGAEILSLNGASGHVTPTSGGAGRNDLGMQLERAVRKAIDGATLIIDERGRGQLVARQSDLYARAG